MSSGTSMRGSSSSKSLMWMTGALFAGMAVLLCGGLFLAGRVVRSVGIRSSLGSATVHTQKGTYRLEHEKELGLPVPMYPHAVLVVPDGENASQTMRDAENGTTRVVYQSRDSRELVDQWFQDHLLGEFQRHEPGETSPPDMLREARVGENDIAFAAERGGHRRIVALSKDSAGTRITIIRTDKPEESAPDQAQAPPQP